jgi:glycosyltransferase A (GT-A) superfamily protein (DUF2064 family)
MRSVHHVLVMAKSPVPGRVKTRLCPALTASEAAAVATAALADTLDAVMACGADRKIVALDGEPGPWLPPGIEVIEQHGSNLTERLANAWSVAGGGGVQIGMDTPQAGPKALDDLLAVLDGPGRRAVLGPAFDGGWWAIGWSGTDPEAVFAGIPTSTSDTGERQRRRLLALGFDVTLARTLRDIDAVDDLLAVANDVPGTRTARIAADLGVSVQGRVA